MAVIIEVENLGPIRKGKVELKPLTVFIGPNNTGKTYLAYLIAGIIEHCWKSIKLSEFIGDKLPRRKRKKPFLSLKITVEEIEELLEGGIIKKEVEVDLKNFIFSNIDLIRSIFIKLNEKINQTVQEFVRENYWEFLGSDIETLIRNVKIYIKLTDFNIERYLKQIFESNIDRKDFAFVTICKKSNTYKLHVSLNPKEFREFLKIMGEIIGDTIRDHETIHETVEIALHYIVLKSIIDIVVYPFSAIVRIFPAQRNTLMLDFVKSAINIATREEKEQIRLIKSEPILKFLKLIDLFIPSKSEKK